MVEGRHAVPPLADGADELPGLVEAKGLKGIAFFRVAGRAGQGEEVRGHGPFPVSLAARTGQDGAGGVQPVGGGPGGPVQLADVVIPPGPVALGQFPHLENARGPRLELGDPGDPVLHVLRFARLPVLRPVPGDDLLQRRAHRPDRTEQVLGEVDAVNAHVPELPGGGHAPVLAPSHGMFAPVLEALEPRVADLAEVSRVDQMLEVAHARHEPVSEGGHVADAGASGGIVHVDGLRHGHADGFLAEHVATRLDAFEHDVAVVDVRHGDGHGVRPDGGQEPVHLRETGRDAPLGLPAGQQVAVHLAQTGDFHARNAGEPRVMYVFANRPEADEPHAQVVRRPVACRHAACRHNAAPV